MQPQLQHIRSICDSVRIERASRFLCLLYTLLFSTAVPVTLHADTSEAETNRQIRLQKFDAILPAIMREQQVDMWIHVVREAVPDPFALGELGSTSGLIVFADRGGERIERAVLGRRWGATQRQNDEPVSMVEESGAYDYIAPAVTVRELPSTPKTEYDYRFEGLREFVKQRNPKVIAVNFIDELGPWPTFRGAPDGISHTDYRLLTAALGKKFSARLISSEYLIMNYIARKVPAEVEMLKRLSKARVAEAKQRFAGIQPGITRVEDAGVTVSRRTRTGLSQRGRSAGWENAVVQGGDILSMPSYGMYAYVLRPGEVSPPDEINRLWWEYVKVEKVLAETVRSGVTPRQVVADYTAKFAKMGIVVRPNQLHMETPKNDYPTYIKGFPAGQTHISVDAHGQMKGAREESVENYFGPRIGSLGPDWTHDIILPEYHHFVIEYFFYLPSPAPEGEDQYLLWWAHEQAMANSQGIVYLSPPQQDLILIPSQ